jgi:BlaI family transcriptional regulator, penicillinase repressor
MPELLGDLQLQVMEVVWRLGRTTVAEVHQALAERRRIAYTTVLTTLRALERRGIVRHDKAGKAFVYSPTMTRDQYTVATVGKVVDDLFEGRQEALLCHILGTERIGKDDLAEIRRLAGRRTDKGGKP